VIDQRRRICAVANHFDVCPEAVAGAILWDPLENPYKRRFFRLSHGRVHPFKIWGPCAAAEAEEAGLVPRPPNGLFGRIPRVRLTDWSVFYTGAVLALHASHYNTIAGVQISHDPAVLCTLFHGGDSRERAERLRKRREIDAAACPVVADEMGCWVQEHLDWIQSMINGQASFDTDAGEGEPLFGEGACNALIPAPSAPNHVAPVRGG
jgi:hypothetical protein